ncbi:sulfurtransferase [Hydrogenophaga sp. OTU3427]|uniref:sulfurtransferase n=1 Tax=Hydrogenophaga sp. OTU3427 TaxID=3043856 RepID=UPI00313E0D17
MFTTPLISVDHLSQLMETDPLLLVLDCSFDLTDAHAGRRAYDAGHVPLARHVHLDTVLSGVKNGRNGRHPLPEPQAFAHAMAALGAQSNSHIVAYDNASGMYAARLWWLLRWAGHAQVAVLDGGIEAYRRAALPLSTQAPAPATGNFDLRPTLVNTIDYRRLRTELENPQRRVLDARAPDRFRGENENLDPVGGHIPGAHNRFFRDNLNAQGLFKPAAQLRAEFEPLMNGLPATSLVSQCGSGVTACHQLLALELAELPGATLYPGSWSEWCAQPDTVIATGT